MLSQPLEKTVPEGCREVFTTRIRFKSGKVIYAKDYGLKAFRIFVKDKPPKAANDN